MSNKDVVIVEVIKKINEEIHHIILFWEGWNLFPSSNC